jgi:hypothetical protein
MKTFRVFLKTGGSFVVQADAFSIPKELNSRVEFKANEKSLSDLYLLLGEVAAIIPEESGTEAVK